MKRVAWLVLCACGSNYHSDASATRVSPPPPLQHIALAAADGFASICPGAPFQIVVTGTTTTGRQLTTPTSYQHGIARYAEHGLPWQRFQLSASVGALSPAALFTTPSLFVLAETSTVTFHAVDRTNPQLTADASFPVDFKCGQMFSLRGDTGSPGGTGAPGIEGGIGGHVEIRIGRLATRAHGPVILARVDSVLGRSYFLLQPGGGALVVDLTGGQGGDGGAGQEYPGTTTTDAHGTTTTTSGYTGPPGAGGAGGPGGSAVIRVDASDPLLAQAVKVYNPGGPRGTGGQIPMAGLGPPGLDGVPGPMPNVTYEDAAVLFADELARGFPIALPQVAHSH